MHAAFGSRVPGAFAVFAGGSAGGAGAGSREQERGGGEQGESGCRDGALGGSF